MRDLKQNSIYKKLAKNCPQYAGLSQIITDGMAPVLELIKNHYPNFPDHGLQHSLRILDYISAILGDNIKKLSDMECFIFILVSIFHDSAMAKWGEIDIDDNRENHHLYASEFIDSFFDEYLKILGEKDRLKPESVKLGL